MCPSEEQGLVDSRVRIMCLSGAIDGGKRGYTEKTTDLLQVTEKHTVATDYKNTMYMLLHSDTLS
jgi:hypothetical protein